MSIRRSAKTCEKTSKAVGLFLSTGPKGMQPDWAVSLSVG
jgi:hypothetical protein